MCLSKSRKGPKNTHNEKPRKMSLFNKKVLQYENCFYKTDVYNIFLMLTILISFATIFAQDFSKKIGSCKPANSSFIITTALFFIVTISLILFRKRIN